MISTIQYTAIDEALHYLNAKLFDGKLPDVLITLSRKPKVAAFHWHEKFRARENEEKISEISLNPDTFLDKTDTDILSDLAHELVHQWQHLFGTAPRKGYHDREWASKMKEIGLYPSSTGEVGGKETGQSMSDYIIEGGKFEIVCGAFLLNRTAIFWNSIPQEKVDKKKNKTREKFVCPTCTQAAWAKKGANLACGDCMVKLVIEEDDNE